MNRRISKLYTCTMGNRVIVYDSNYSGFYSQLRNILEGCKNEKYYNKRFNDLGEFKECVNGVVYCFQKLI